jgi:hypothetical protein
MVNDLVFVGASIADAAAAPMTVVETGEFLKQAKPLMSGAERAELVAFIGQIRRRAKSCPRPAGFGRSGLPLKERASAAPASDLLLLLPQ